MLTIESHTCNSGQSTCFENRFVYTIDGSGKLAVEHTITPWGRMPEWLPRIRLQMLLDSSLNRYRVMPSEITFSFIFEPYSL